MISTREVFESDQWKIKCIYQGRNGMVRIDGVTRFHIADGINRFSKWVSVKYVNKLSLEYYGKNISDMSIY
jgi:hypothetical protein